MTTRQPIRMVVVGCGECLQTGYGPILPFVTGIKVVAAVDPDEEALRGAMEAFGIASGYRTLEICLEQEEIDAALIASPVYYHREHAITCAERSVHVLLEKPMARTPFECDEIIAAHRAAGTLLMIGFMKRFNRSMLRVAEMLRDGAIGQVMGVRHTWDWGAREHPSFSRIWRSRLETWGGQWQDHGSHSVDLAHWWAGPVRSVFATFDITLPNWEVDTEYNVICTHVSGVRSTHQSSKFFNREGEERYLIFGETGTIELRHTHEVWQYTTPYELYLHRYGKTRENHQPPFSTSWLEEGKRFGQFKVELDHFAECVALGKRPVNDGESGRAVTEVIAAAYLSAQEGREIALPLTTLPDYEAFFQSIPRRVPPRYQGTT
jgi:predicted dehydrogenase